MLILDRFEIQYLCDWFNRTNRKPLIIKGARQVGKSTLVRLFAKKQQLDLIELDFEQNPDNATLFNSNDPKIIISLISVKLSKNINLKKAVLFLDEIQKTPQIIGSLRYFYEQMPELAVIVTGSLLDLALTNINFSIPVGRIEYLYLGPMSFQAFLLAIGSKKLIEFIKNYQLLDDIPIAIHKTLLENLKAYFIVGGLPESVAKYSINYNFVESNRIKSSLITAYQEDFAKYAAKAKQQRMRLIFNKIPQILGEKFKYSNISKENKSVVIKDALDDLMLSRVINKVTHTYANGVPLKAEINENHFKTYFLDVGLVTCMLDLNILNLANISELTLINSGKIAEQFIAQHLLYFRDLYEIPELYYWDREQKGSSAEIDFVIAYNGKIIPIEVKAGVSGSLKSLHYFLKEKNLNLAVKFSSQKPGLLQEQILFHEIGRKKYKLLSLPLYLVEELGRLLETH